MRDVWCQRYPFIEALQVIRVTNASHNLIHIGIDKLIYTNWRCMVNPEDLHIRRIEGDKRG